MVLDAHPSTASHVDAPLRLGETASFCAAGVHVSLLAVEPYSADAQVEQAALPAEPLECARVAVRRANAASFAPDLEPQFVRAAVGEPLDLGGTRADFDEGVGLRRFDVTNRFRNN